MKNKIEDLKSTIQELIELFEEQNLEHWAEMYILSSGRPQRGHAC